MSDTAPEFTDETAPADVQEDPNEQWIVYTDAEGNRQRITVTEYHKRGL